MNEKQKLKLRTRLLLSAKIGVGASASIYLAQLVHLEYATSAGIITLLTLITTRWETIRLSLMRLVTYVITVLLCWSIFRLIPNMWIEYGLFLFCIVFLGEVMGWRSTLSVNAVIGTHFLTTQNFTTDFLINELLLVVIGIVIALLLNLLHINNAQEHGLIHSMRHVEQRMKQILVDLSAYLLNQTAGKHVWDDLIRLEKELEEYLESAYEYQNNTFHSHPEYYINYFEMRMKQCGALHNLHAELRRMRNMPVQAHIVADYIMDISQYLTEMNYPTRQMAELEGILEQLRTEDLPKTHEEFESRAELYHVLMDIEEFLLYKKRFVDDIDVTQFNVYWKREIEKRS